MTTGSSRPIILAAAGTLKAYQLQLKKAMELEVALRKEALAVGATITQDEIIYPAGYVPKTLEQHKKELGWE